MHLLCCRATSPGVILTTTAGCFGLALASCRPLALSGRPTSCCPLAHSASLGCRRLASRCLGFGFAGTAFALGLGLGPSLGLCFCLAFPLPLALALAASSLLV